MGKLSIGPVSEGTLRTQDLLDTLGYKLSRVAENDEDKQFADQCAEMSKKLEDGLLGPYADPKEMLQDLMDKLGEYVPAYCYFGANEGDGACFGVWPDIEAVEDDVHAAEILKVSDLSEAEGIDADTVVVVNDHGNVALYKRQEGELKLEWDCV